MFQSLLLVVSGIYTLIHPFPFFPCDLKAASGKRKALAVLAIIVEEMNLKGTLHYSQYIKQKHCDNLL